MNARNPPQPSAARLWQFAIRELLLLTAVVAALLALAGVYYQRSQKFCETPVPQRLLGVGRLETICQELGYPPPLSTGVAGPLRNWDGSEYRQEYTMELPPQNRAAVMDALCLRVVGVVRECEIDKCMQRRKTDANGTNGFQLNYCKGTTAGSISVHSTDDPQRIRLSIFVNEHTMAR